LLVSRTCPAGQAKEKGIHHYDVAVSFAGSDRPTVERLVRLLTSKGVRVFYDLWEQSDLWGKNPWQQLDSIYRTNSRYCVVFVSKDYIEKAWPKHELRSAQARALEEASEYILPIRLDDSELPGLHPTTAYVDARTTAVAEICRMLVAKLGLRKKYELGALLYSEARSDRKLALSKVALRGLLEYMGRVIELMLTDRNADTERGRLGH
jgi:hypothetical protein